MLGLSNNSWNTLLRSQRLQVTYSFEVIQSGLLMKVLRDPSLIVLPMCVLEPCIQWKWWASSSFCVSIENPCLTYLRHEHYNRMWCLRVKLFTVCSFQTQNLVNIQLNEQESYRIKGKDNYCHYNETENYQKGNIQIWRSQSQKSASPSKCQDMEFCFL